MKLFIKIAILLASVFLLGSAFTFSSFANEENSFCLIVCAEGEAVVEPVAVTYADGQTIRQALEASGIDFIGLDGDFIYSINDVEANYTLFYDNGGFDLDEPASEITALCITDQIDCGSPELLELIIRMMQYQLMTNNVDKYPAAQSAYNAALTGVCEGVDGETCAECLFNLNTAIADYEALLAGEKYSVSFSAVGQNNTPVEGVSLKLTDVYGNITVSETEQIEVIAGNYDFVVSSGFNRSEGKIAVNNDTSVSVVLPSSEWFGNIRVLDEGEYVPYEQNKNEHKAVYYIDDISSSLAINPIMARGVPDSKETYLYRIYTSKNGEEINERVSWASSLNSLYDLLNKGMEGNTAILEARYTGADGITMIQTYDLNFVRVPSLSSLQVKDATGADLLNGFSPRTTAYSFSIPYGEYTVEAVPFVNDGSTVSINEGENGSVITINEGVNLVDVTVVHENGQNRTYSLNITGTQAALVSFDAPADTTYEVYTLSGTRLNPETNGRYALVPGEQYYYTSTKNDFFHATQNFIAANGLTVHIVEPDTEDGLEGFCLYDNSSPSFREEYTPEDTFSSSEHTCFYDIPAFAQSIYAQATAINGYTVRAEYLSQEFLNAMTVEINKTVDSQGAATLLKSAITVSGYSQDMTVWLSRTENSVTYTQEYRIKLKRVEQLSSLSLTNVSSSLLLYNGDGSSALPFDRDITAYSIKPQKDEEEITLSGSVLDRKGGYIAIINGITIDNISEDFTINVPLDMEKDEEIISITLDHEDPNSIPTQYTIAVHKLDPVAVTFETDPEEVNIFVMNNLTGKTVYPREGAFFLTPGEEYTYTITKNGYVGTTQVFLSPQENSVISVALTEALENTALKNLDAEWPYFRADKNNNGVVDIKTPTIADNAFLSWATKLGEGWTSGATGCPIIVDGYLYTYASNYLYKVDAVSGEVVAQGEMDRGSSFAINSPTYAEGMIFVGLSDGGVQAFNADTLESLWIYNDPLRGQPDCPIAYYDGYIYTGFWMGETKDAGYVCLSVTDEDPSNPKEEKLTTWRYVQKGGFYWAGAYVCDDFLLIGTDDGDVGFTKGYANILSLDPKNGTLLDKLCLGDFGDDHFGDQRSSITYDTQTGDFYFTTKGGYFYRLSMNDDGTINHDTVRYIKLDNYANVLSQPPMSTCSPCIYNGRAYIGVSGLAQFGEYSGHNITVIDLNKMKIAYKVRTQGYPQTSGLLTTAYDGGDGTVYVYFFDNMIPGKLRIISDKPGQTAPNEVVVETYTDDHGTKRYDTAPILFTPSGKQAQYAICSPITDSYGNIYFKNDSAYLMCLSNTITELEVSEAPEKTDYVPGETFDPSGMIITAHYSNGTSRDVTDYVSYSQEPLTTDDTEFEIRFEYTMYQDKNGEADVLYDAPSAVVNLNVSNEGLVLKGDIDGNRMIDEQDVTQLISHVLGLSSLEGDAKAAADMDDNTLIDENDVTWLIQLVLSQ